MSIGGPNLFKNQNIPNLMQSLGQNPFPMRGLERFMQRRGIKFPEFPQGGTFQGLNSNGQAGSLSDTLNAQVAPEKSGGIKAFLSRFSSKFSK